MDKSGFMKCPFCDKRFQRLYPHLKTNKVCSSLGDYASYKASFDIFDTDLKISKVRENKARHLQDAVKKEEIKISKPNQECQSGGLNCQSEKNKNEGNDF